MITLFENEDFILKSTGQDCDFVGIIETKNDTPLTFFFAEDIHPKDEEDDCEWEIDENKTYMKGDYSGLEDDETGGKEEKEDLMYRLNATSWLTTREDKSTGFLSDCQERGWFLALIKAYCPDQLCNISWA